MLHGTCYILPGANVRDAACYMSWSFARTYDPQQIKPFVNDIASALILTTLFDWLVLFPYNVPSITVHFVIYCVRNDCIISVLNDNRHDNILMQ